MTGTLNDKLMQKAGGTSDRPAALKTKDGSVKLTKSMTIPDMVKALEPEIKRALPSVLTPERFTRMALSALNNTPRLKECTPMSFIAALMNAAQLGLEPNTPLGQAYLIPYKNKGTLECQFQLGYKGMIDLAYRNDRMQSIEAHTIYENDEFYYELGLDARLKHIPTWDDRGDIRGFYAIFKLDNGGYSFEVMGKTVHLIGMPFAYGWTTPKCGDSTNRLTIVACDPNTTIPEAKACCVNIRKADKLTEIA